MAMVSKPSMTRGELDRMDQRGGRRGEKRRVHREREREREEEEGGGEGEGCQLTDWVFDGNAKQTEKERRRRKEKKKREKRKRREEGDWRRKKKGTGVEEGR